MATLTSPGVEVSVINESFYVPSDAGTTPLFIVASSQDKKNGAGDGTASGTTTANANTAYLISSQRELTETFGDPKFYTDASGNPVEKLRIKSDGKVIIGNVNNTGGNTNSALHIESAGMNVESGYDTDDTSGSAPHLTLSLIHI